MTFRFNDINMLRCHGFTLIGLLVMLVILSAVGVSTLLVSKHFRAKHLADTTIHDVASMIHFARQQAVLLGVPVALCASDQQLDCQSLWSEGQLVFVDPLSANQVMDSGQVLRAYPKTDGGGSLNFNAFGNRSILRFLPTGWTDNQNGTFVYCSADKNPLYARAVIVAKSGRIRLSQPDTSGGIHLDANGQPLRCD